jgi:hypothetical protein
MRSLKTEARHALPSKMRSFLSIQMDRMINKQSELKITFGSDLVGRIRPPEAQPIAPVSASGEEDRSHAAG